jgi:ribosomal protein S6
MDEAFVEPKEYEVSFLARTEEDAADAAQLVRQHATAVDAEQPLRKIQLAYKIARETQAYFGCMRTKAVPSAAKQLEIDFKMNTKVMRSLVISLPAISSRTFVPSAVAARRSATAPSASAYQPSERKSTPPPILSNEALEKKIEEILQ